MTATLMHRTGRSDLWCRGWSAFILRSCFTCWLRRTSQESDARSDIISFSCPQLFFLFRKSESGSALFIKMRHFQLGRGRQNKNWAWSRVICNDFFGFNVYFFPSLGENNIKTCFFLLDLTWTTILNMFSGRCWTMVSYYIFLQHVGASFVCHHLLNLSFSCKSSNTETHKALGWSSHTDLLWCARTRNRQQGEMRRRETHRQRDHLSFSSPASLSLPSPCWAWQLFAGSRSICLSLQRSDMQSTWFLMP